MGTITLFNINSKNCRVEGQEYVHDGNRYFGQSYVNGNSLFVGQQTVNRLFRQSYWADIHPCLLRMT